MVGGRISPSFTSALSMELSNNLRTKTEREKTQVRICFFCVSSFHCARWIPIRGQLAIHTTCRVPIELSGKSYTPCREEENTGNYNGNTDLEKEQQNR